MYFGPNVLVELVQSHKKMKKPTDFSERLYLLFIRLSQGSSRYFEDSTEICFLHFFLDFPLLSGFLLTC